MNPLNLFTPSHQKDFDFFLKNNPSHIVSLESPISNIAERSAVKWGNLGKNNDIINQTSKEGQLKGWSGQNKEVWKMCVIEVESLRNLTSTSTQRVWINIENITGISSSKSELSDYQSISEFAQDKCQGLIKEVSEDSLKKSLDHKEIRIIHGKGDGLTQYAWEDKIFLSNQGGSHHFAAAHYLAEKLGKSVKIESDLKIEKLSEKAVNDLNNEFAIFAFPNSPELLNDFHDLMEKNKASYYFKEMIKPYDAQMIFLPKKNKMSKKIAEKLKSNGFSDLGEKLNETLLYQKEVLNKMSPKYETSDISTQNILEKLEKRRNEKFSDKKTVLSSSLKL